MKVYGKTLIIYLLVFITGVMVRYLFQPYIKEPYLEIIFKSFLAVSFTTLIYKFIKGKLFKTIRLKGFYFVLLFILIILFGINNYFQVTYSKSQYYPEILKSALGIYTITYIISSTSEEIIYRGFIQTFINENRVTNTSKISKGNIFATLLFFLTHLGFFTIMPPLFAITSLCNVIVFSLIAGYLYDKTKNILIPVLLHILLNMIHIIIQVTL